MDDKPDLQAALETVRADAYWHRTGVESIEAADALSNAVVLSPETWREAREIIRLWVDKPFPFGRHDDINRSRAFLAAHPLEEKP